MPRKRIHPRAVALLTLLGLAAALGVSFAGAQTGAPAVAGSARIAFIRNSGPMSGDAKELYVMNADGSGQTRLARGGMFGFRPAWSPDGRRLAFVLYGSNPDIYVVNGDGSGQRRLTRTTAEELFPVWSPDGRKIAFIRSEGVYVIDADGSGQRRLADVASIAAPDWSPDGRKIAFVSNRDGNDEVYVMNANGSGQRNLTRNPARDSFFPDIQAPVAQHSSWSPDGRQITFVSNRDANPEIYVMNADGSGLRRLTKTPKFDGDPAWSPDGRKIAFASRRDGNPEVYVMNADGSGQRNLTRNPALDSAPAWSQRDSAPAWSPDGKTIAFQSNRDRNWEIYIVSADGSGQRNLTRYRNNDGGFAWSPVRTG